MSSSERSDPESAAAFFPDRFLGARVRVAGATEDGRIASATAASESESESDEEALEELKMDQNKKSASKE